MNYLPKILTLLLAPALLSAGPKIPRLSKKTCPDLTVTEISKPAYDRKTRKSTVRVNVKNIGGFPSDTAALRVADAEAEGYSDALSEGVAVGNFGDKVKHKKSFMIKVLPLSPGEARAYTVVFDYWVYDPDCELEAVIDPDKLLAGECSTENNRALFLDREKR